MITCVCTCISKTKSIKIPYLKNISDFVAILTQQYRKDF